MLTHRSKPLYTINEWDYDRFLFTESLEIVTYRDKEILS